MGYRKCRSVRSAKGDFQNEPCLVNCLNFVTEFWVKVDGHESAEPTLDRDSPIAHIVLPVNGRIYLADRRASALFRPFASRTMTCIG